MRRDERSAQAFLVVANLNPAESLHDVSIQIPDDALSWLSRKHQNKKSLTFADTLGSQQKWKAVAKDLPSDGLLIGELPAMSALYLKIK